MPTTSPGIAQLVCELRTFPHPLLTVRRSFGKNTKKRTTTLYANDTPFPRHAIRTDICAATFTALVDVASPRHGRDRNVHSERIIQIESPVPSPLNF